MNSVNISIYLLSAYFRFLSFNTTNASSVENASLSTLFSISPVNWSTISKMSLSLSLGELSLYLFTSSHILQKRLLNPNVLKYSAPSFAKVSNFPIFCAFSIFLQLHSNIAVNTRFLSTFICIYSINIFAISAFNTIDLSKNIPVFFDK